MRLCALSGLRVRINLLHINRLLRHAQLVRLKRPIRMNNSCACRVDFLQGLCDLFDIAMTSEMDIIRFVQRTDEHRDGCYMIRPT